MDDNISQGVTSNKLLLEPHEYAISNNNDTNQRKRRELRMEEARKKQGVIHKTPRSAITVTSPDFSALSAAIAIAVNGDTIILETDVVNKDIASWTSPDLREGVIFNGNGHHIGHPTNTAHQLDHPLFNFVGALSSAVLSVVNNVTVYVNINDSSEYNTGGVASLARNAEFNNCTARGSISNSRNGLSNAGGIAGRAYPNCQFDECSNYAEVTCTAAPTVSNIGAGGIAGWAGTSVFTNCENHGGVNGTFSVGGILGRVNNVVQESHCIIRNCVNWGKISGTQCQVGGIVGWYVVSSIATRGVF